MVADVPIGARPHFEYGSALQKEGRLEEAVEQYKIGLQFNPKDAKAHTSLAVALTGQAKFDAAVPHMETALRLEPNNPDFPGNFIMQYNCPVSAFVLAAVFFARLTPSASAIEDPSGEPGDDEVHRPREAITTEPGRRSGHGGLGRRGGSSCHGPHAV